MKYKWAFLVLFLSMTTLSFGLDLKSAGQVQLSQDNKLVGYCNSFCVTEHDIFVLPDLKTGDIKLFDKRGQLIRVFGKRGIGPNEFMTITAVDYDSPDLAILDIRRQKVFIYSFTGKTDLKYKKEFLAGAGFDIGIAKDTVYISASKQQGTREYALYSYNLKNDHYSYLIPSEIQFGYDSYSRYKANFEYDSLPIGKQCYFDFWNDNVYSAWAGDLKIIKVDTMDHTITHFGKITQNYKKPLVSPRYKKAFLEKNIKLMEEEGRKLDYVRDIFAGKDYIGVVYSTPDEELDIFVYWIQFYRPSGEFIKEIKPSVTFRPPLFFDKAKDTLYSLYRDDQEELHILKHRVER